MSLGAFEGLTMAPTPDAARAYIAQIDASHVVVSEPNLAWHARFNPEGHVRD